MEKRYFTSESVTEGHPDKLCDRISDAVLDAIIAQDPNARVACETACTTGMILVMGEITTHCYVDIPKIARQAAREIGYDRAKFGFDCQTCAVLTAIDEQSGDIAMGVDQSLEAKAQGGGEEDNGAGDQGMMFGYACDETPELMPMPIMLAHALCRRLTQVRKEGLLDYLRPDGKAQVTVEYQDDKPVRVETVVLSTQHSPDVEMDQLRRDLLELVIRQAIPAELLDENTKYYITPTGRFVIGGPAGDSGLTGRKIIVDTYGGYARHGGSYHNLIPDSLSAFGLQVDSVTERTAENAASLLESGHILVALMGRGSLTQNGHFIVITQLCNNGNVYIADPANYENCTKEWNLQQLMDELKRVYDHGGPLWAVSMIN